MRHEEQVTLRGAGRRRAAIVLGAALIGIIAIERGSFGGNERSPGAGDSARAPARSVPVVPAAPSSGPGPEDQADFIANHGQWSEKVRYFSRAGAVGAWIVPGGWTLVLEERMPRERIPAPDLPGMRCPESGPRRAVAVRMSFEGGPEVVPCGEAPRPGIYNFFRGQDPARWRTRVPACARVRYSEVAEGIDVVLRQERGVFEYDVELAPGAALEDLVIRCDGQESLRTEPDGTLVMETAAGPVRQKPPRAWVEADSGDRTPVTCRYRLVDARSFGFEAPLRDADLRLLVDPGLVFSTLMGGALTDYGRRIVVDESGNIFLAGGAASSDFPTTPGVFDPSHAGSLDVFVARMAADGTALAYCTFIGGAGSELCAGLSVDAAGQGCIAGPTASADFPVTTGAYDPSHNGADDVFIVKVSADGASLLLSTFLGGSGNDAGDVHLDGAGNLVVSGGTSSAGFPTTPGAFDTTYNGGQDGFVARLDPTGSVLQSATFLGGSSLEFVRATSGPGNATYVLGITSSSDLPVTPGAFDQSYNGAIDSFVAKLDAAGSTLAFCTYLGGTGQELCAQIVADDQGRALVSGCTSSADFPTTSGVLGPVFGGGGRDVYLARVSADGSSLLLGTYLGGSGSDINPAGLFIDGSGRIFLSGVTTSSDFPVTPCSFDTTHNGDGDGFVTVLDAAAATLLYGSFLGGVDLDHPFGMDVDGLGNVYVKGMTYSPDFPVTSGAFDTTLAGAPDVFVMKLDVFLSPEEAQAQLIIEIAALVAQGVMNSGQGNALAVKVEASIQHAAAGRETPAINQLEAFVNQVNAFISAGILTQAQAQPLLDLAAVAISALGG